MSPTMVSVDRLENTGTAGGVAPGTPRLAPSPPAAHAPRPSARPAFARWAWAVAALALFVPRLAHLAGPIDDPHSWRQCDTVHYTLDFYRNGIDLLHPAVCWLGGHRTLILEFPLPEAMAAVLYRAFGPDPMWDRAVALGFFVVATAYLFALVRAIATERIAWIATLVYLALPLGLFYSRAAHVDFAATAFAHAWAYHAIVAVRRRSLAHAGGAAAAGALAAMIKMPYLVPVAGPIAVAVLAVFLAGGPAAFALAAVATMVPAVAFVLWRRHVDAVNAAAPDWNFLPGYYKESNALWWYIGQWTQRIEVAPWKELALRVVRQVTTPLGALLAVAGLCTPLLARDARAAGEARRWTPGPVTFAVAWSAAAFAYLIVFFPLNVIHSYYQIPFLAPVALLIANAADRAWGWRPHRLGRIPVGLLVLALFLVMAVRAGGRQGYYRIDELRVDAGRRIARIVPKDDLIVIADPTSGHSDPRLLVRADHAGWPLAIADLEPSRLARLEALGARWVAVVTEDDTPPPPAFLEPGRVALEKIASNGPALGTLHVYDLRKALAAGPAAVAP